jgi:hypothetical protein
MTMTVGPAGGHRRFWLSTQTSARPSLPVLGPTVAALSIRPSP